MTQATGDAATFVEHRERLLRVAYRIVGTVTDAEDVVQEAWLRWARVDTAAVDEPLAFLARTTTRLAIDRLRRVAARRETYSGQWLPEPYSTERPVEDAAVTAEDISMAMMRVLETLTPLERAAFVLREAFDLRHSEIAEILDRSEPAVRQLAARARRRINERHPRYTADLQTARETTADFLDATRTGDVARLMEVLAPGVKLIADSDGKVRAPLLPVIGAQNVSRFLLTVAARELPSVDVSMASVNGAPAVVVSAFGRTQAVLAFDVEEGRIVTIYLQANPDKLSAMSRRNGGAASVG